ncbi:MAG TPA: hypothetical protein VF546_16620 [Pyrinomonadaceae bacterium]|jgi:hypothetical protein
MTAKLNDDASQGQTMSDSIKSWVMVLLTLLFVLLYGAALVGWLKPLADEKMVMRLEPIIFVIIGYYFGRLPAQQTEKTLKDEITRQTQKADAAQQAKEQVQRSREALDEKIKNARAALATGASAVASKGLAEKLDKAGATVTDESLRSSVAAALNILNS